MMDRLLQLMSEKKASDLFLAPGAPVQIKINGAMVPVNQQRLAPENVVSLIREIVEDRHWEQFEKQNELNLGYGVRSVGSFRVNVFRQRGSAACVIRFIPHDIPKLDTLHLPTILGDLVMEKRGLLLVVGATGSGKSTTLASMIDHRNEQKTGHILTLEDPIEFTFQNKRSIVNQRQIGTDTNSLEVALKNAMRQAPDCILIGEIRDTSTMSNAIAYAQSGHLVLATLHANNANQTLDRIINFFPDTARHQLLIDLSLNLKAVISQRLVKGRDGKRLPAVELLLQTPYVSDLIEKGEIDQLKEAMKQGVDRGMQTFDESLFRLYKAGRITLDTALDNADSRTDLGLRVRLDHPVDADSADPALRLADDGSSADAPPPSGTRRS